jgi:hypothetical protein
MQRLRSLRDELREELEGRLAKDPRLSQLPPGGVLIGAPAPFTSHLAHQLLDGLLGRTEIRVRHLRARKKGTVHIGTFLGKMKSGVYALDVKVSELRGRLGADKPEIHYEADRARVRVPAAIRGGRGRATLHFQWESKGLTGLACGDVDVTEAIDGRVIPHRYPVEVNFDLRLDGDVVTATPRVPDVRIRLYVEPSETSWAAVDRLRESQGLRCRTALKLVDLRDALQGVLDRGLKVTIPGRIFKPVRLPAAFRDSVTFAGRTYALAVEPLGLQAVEDTLWYGAELTAEVESPRPEARPVIPLPAASPVPLPTSQPGEERGFVTGHRASRQP